jgi:hypothetical protein
MVVGPSHLLCQAVPDTYRAIVSVIDDACDPTAFARHFLEIVNFINSPSEIDNAKGHASKQVYDVCDGEEDSFTCSSYEILATLMMR